MKPMELLLAALLIRESEQFDLDDDMFLCCIMLTICTLLEHDRSNRERAAMESSGESEPSDSDGVNSSEEGWSLFHYLLIL